MRLPYVGWGAPVQAPDIDIVAPSEDTRYLFECTRFVYASPSQPEQTFDYDMKTRERTLRKTQEVPSGHDPDLYVVERIQARAEDGAEIPVTAADRFSCGRTWRRAMPEPPRGSSSSRRTHSSMRSRGAWG